MEGKPFHFNGSTLPYRIGTLALRIYKAERNESYPT